MSVKIRLTRKGKKNYAYYHIIVADSKAPRDGRYIERLGSYNPNTDPATVQLNFDKALQWLQNGATPTDTCRSILSKQGVLMKKHLLDGVKKGAFSEEDAESKFVIWTKDKELKINEAKKTANDQDASEAKKRLEAETKVNVARAQELAAKRKKELEAKAAANAKVDETTEEGDAQETVEEDTEA